MDAATLPDRPFTWAHAQKHGWSRGAITELVDGRVLERVLQGVYQRRTLPNTMENRLLAASLVIRPHQVVADRLAAWVYGVDAYSYSERLYLPPIETVAPPARSRQRRAGCIGRNRDLAASDVLSLGGLQVTTPLRTALDLGCSLRPRDALAALDGLMRECGVQRNELIGEIPRFAGRRGVLQLRRLSVLADPRAESAGESWTRMTIVEADLPVPDLQVWVGPYRVDLGYEGVKTGVEYDGADDHTAPEDRAHDRERRLWLADRGWQLIIVSKPDFTRERAAVWTGQLRTLLRLDG